jgi:hypothetical protein
VLSEVLRNGSCSLRITLGYIHAPI